MSCGGRVSAAIAFAAAFFVCCLYLSPSPSWAADERVLLFSGIDVWYDGAFTHAGALWSPYGLEREGFTLKVMAAGGFYRYRAGALGDVTVVGAEESGQVMPGWRFKRDQLEITVYGGLDFQHDVTSPFDPANRLNGWSIGARGAVDLWYEPTGATMLAFNAFVSSINTDYSVRAAYGWRLFNSFYLGPEAQTFDCVGYRQLRVGLHLTALKIGPIEWSAAAGWSEDSDHRSSPYLRLGILARF